MGKNTFSHHYEIVQVLLYDMAVIFILLSEYQSKRQSRVMFRYSLDSLIKTGQHESWQTYPSF